MDCRGRPPDSLAMTHYLSHFFSVIARSRATKQSSLPARVFRTRLLTCKILKSLVSPIIPDFVLQDDCSTLVLFSIHFSIFYNGAFFTLLSKCDDFHLAFQMRRFRFVFQNRKLLRKFLMFPVSLLVYTLFCPFSILI